MTGKELRRLKRRELLKMLLVQCEETERLQEEVNEIKREFDVMSESYERLKRKLDVKDERLNQKDAQIAELKAELEKFEEAGEAGKENVASMAEAAFWLDEMFAEAESVAEKYLEKVRKLRDGVRRNQLESGAPIPVTESDEIGREVSGAGDLDG
ncbi:MAG: hypothetical protein HFI67_08840 [Lachnospiraceae bacterium]|jgi:chromosome segregation ATPase|nr:hypothetical protein [Lachnospiraceae bacterium]